MTRIQANRKKRQIALELRLKGLSYAEIGEALSVSRQRAQQLTSPSPDVSAFIRKKAKGKCADCGIKIRSGRIMNERGAAEDYDDIPNLVYLCVGCYRLRHEGVSA